MTGFFIYKAEEYKKTIKERSIDMKRMKFILGMLLLVLTPVWQSCDDDDGYSLGDIGADWATVKTTGGGGYYLEGDSWGIIYPVATSIPWYRPVHGQRVISFFNPLGDMKDKKGVQVKMEGIYELLTKGVEELTEENEEAFGDDPIAIIKGGIWLGGKHLNLVFIQDLPSKKKHRISLVQDKKVAEPSEDGYIHLQLRYNTYEDVTNLQGRGRVSFSLKDFYPENELAAEKLKGFKVLVNLKTSGKKEIVLDIKHDAEMPKEEKEGHTASMLE